MLIDVPLDLTALPNIISKVAVECELSIRNVKPASAGVYNQMVRTGRTEVNVVNGSVVQTVQVLVTVPSITRIADPQAPNPTSYGCKLLGFLDEGLGWHAFWLASSQQARQNRHDDALSEVILLEQNSSNATAMFRAAVVAGTVQWPVLP